MDNQEIRDDAPDLNLEGDDGLTEIIRVMENLTFAWGVLAENASYEPFADHPWALTDVWAETSSQGIRTIRGTYKNATENSFILIGAAKHEEPEKLIEHVATAIMYTAFRRATGQFPSKAVLDALRSPITLTPKNGWQVGSYGSGKVLLQIGILQDSNVNGQLLAISQTMDPQSFYATLNDVSWLEGPGQEAIELHKRHRQALADLWWSAPRVPYTVPLKYVRKDAAE